MEFKLDFTEVSSPTAKQIDLVQAMCLVLGKAKPEYTFEAYSQFIDENMEEYKCAEYEEFGKYY